MKALLNILRRNYGSTPAERQHRRIVCTYTASVALAGCLVFDALAQTAAQSAAAMPAGNLLDVGMVVRFLGGILLAFIAYWTRGIEKRTEGNEHEIKQLQTQITLMREQMLRDYMTKHEIEKFSNKVTESLDRMNDRLDYLIQPGPRRSGDRRDDAGYTHREG